MERNLFIANSEEETYSLGKTFAKNLNLGENIGFFGDLGSGKTVFIKGICSFFEIKEYITSPTFNFLNIYQGLKQQDVINIYHIDLYRIRSEIEVQDIGITEWLYEKKAIKLIEWADRISNMNNLNYEIKIFYNLENLNRRIVEIIKKI